MSDPKDGAIFDFNVKRYEEHRKTLLAVVQEERQMERYVVLACGGFYSWLATQNSGGDVFFQSGPKNRDRLLFSQGNGAAKSIRDSRLTPSVFLDILPPNSPGASR